MTLLLITHDAGAGRALRAAADHGPRPAGRAGTAGPATAALVTAGGGAWRARARLAARAARPARRRPAALSSSRRLTLGRRRSSPRSASSIAGVPTALERDARGAARRRPRDRAGQPADHRRPSWPGCCRPAPGASASVVAPTRWPRPAPAGASASASRRSTTPTRSSARSVLDPPTCRWTRRSRGHGAVVERSAAGPARARGRRHRPDRAMPTFVIRAVLVREPDRIGGLFSRHRAARC